VNRNGEISRELKGGKGYVNTIQAIFLDEKPEG